MKYGTAMLAGLLGVLMVTAPVSAHHREGHQGGPSKEVSSQSDTNKSNKDEKQNKHIENQVDENEGQGRGLHLGQLLHDLEGNEANRLEGEFDDCTGDNELRDMSVGQIKRLVHATGIGKSDLKDILSTKDSHATGLRVLVRNNLDELQDELRDRLDSENLDNLPPGKIIQAARACGLTPRELVDVLNGE
jgi:hypothetical protein